MARPSIWREKQFDPDAGFIVSRAFTISGQQQVRGRSFDKSLCSLRRLRQLFEQRKIDQVEAPKMQYPPGFVHVDLGKSQQMETVGMLAVGAAPPATITADVDGSSEETLLGIAPARRGRRK